MYGLGAAFALPLLAFGLPGASAAMLRAAAEVAADDVPNLALVLARFGTAGPFAADLEAVRARVASAEAVWPELCLMDSDADGRSNGVELNDPTCAWRIGGVAPSAVNLTDPSTKDVGVQQDDDDDDDDTDTDTDTDGDDDDDDDDDVTDGDDDDDDDTDGDDDDDTDTDTDGFDTDDDDDDNNVIIDDDDDQDLNNDGLDGQDIGLAVAAGAAGLIGAAAFVRYRNNKNAEYAAQQQAAAARAAQGGAGAGGGFGGAAVMGAKAVPVAQPQGQVQDAASNPWASTRLGTESQYGAQQQQYGGGYSPSSGTPSIPPRAHELPRQVTPYSGAQL